MEVLVTRGSPEVLTEIGLDALIGASELVIPLPLYEADLKSADGVAHRVRYLDIDPADGALVWCFETIKSEWEAAHPEKAHLGHAAAGLWFFYWFAPGMRHMSELLRANESDALRAAARDYIGKGFGWDGNPDLGEDE